MNKNVKSKLKSTKNFDENVEDFYINNKKEMYLNDLIKEKKYDDLRFEIIKQDLFNLDEC